MNKEIKEILDELTVFKNDEKNEYVYLNHKELICLLDYITNLQTDLEHEKEINKTLVKYGNEAKKEITNLQEELKYQKEMEEEYNKKHIELMNMYSGLKAENKTLRSDFKNQVECATNIQEENQRLNNEKELFYKISEERLNKWLKLNEENDELVKIIKKNNENYKSRIDKAIEYIEKYCEDYIIEDSPDEMCLFYNENGNYKPEAKKDLLNILQGSDDNE